MPENTTQRSAPDCLWRQHGNYGCDPQIFLPAAWRCGGGNGPELRARSLAGWLSGQTHPYRGGIPRRAGGGGDAWARALARELEAVLGQPLIIENRPGGNNVIGVKAVTNAAADGYTLFYGTNSPMAANAVFFRDLGYDPVKDFTPVAMFGRSRWVVVVSAESPIRSFADLVEASKRQTGGVSFA